MIIEGIIRMRREYIRVFGRDPVRIDISEAMDQQLCDEMEAAGQWTPFPHGRRPRSMHGGKIHGIAVNVVPSIDYAMDWSENV